MEYFVEFTQDDSGKRMLDCSNNAKSDSEHICRCDKQFAENIARTERSCLNNEGADPDFGDYCMNEKFRTKSGTNADTGTLGSFNPKEQCSKAGNPQDGNADRCCGLYPNRYPYDSNLRECCRTHGHDGDANPVSFFDLVRKNECTGEVVVSDEADPHKYSVVL